MANAVTSNIEKRSMTRKPAAWKYYHISCLQRPTELLLDPTDEVDGRTMVLSQSSRVEISDTTSCWSPAVDT